MSQLKKNTRKVIKYGRYFGLKSVIFSAGMPRSGSTLLYNSLRIILQYRYGDQVGSGWIKEIDDLPKSEIYLIKTHSLGQLDILRSKRIFYSYRDIRDVLISRLRKFNKEPRIEDVRRYLKQDKIARSNADLVVGYDQLTSNLEEVISQVTNILNIDVSPDYVTERLPSVDKVDAPDGWHERNTLLHNDHATGTEKGEWQDILSRDLIDQIHSEFEWWFKENGYEI